MNISQFLIRITLFTLLLSPLNAANTIEDTGTIRLSWSEFSTSEKSLGTMKIGRAYVNRDAGDEWNKYKIKFSITNTEQNNKSLKFIISIFDSKQQLIFSGSDEKSLSKLETDEVDCKAKISNRVKFEPETVYVRIWWEVGGD